ncbi:PucR family transcriptional regulator [Amycolatopsis anabasis]|uniref:PucR family transcriptional regulator n=1 Tax=Amycolatopsis anabasis TaxID=1840409 RepID=UPI00131D485C|nr:PucR family transcriptional regulator [Amycolatopsis anabasis]
MRQDHAARTRAPIPGERADDQRWRMLAQRLRPHAGAVARSIVEGVRQAVPAYTRPLGGLFGEVLTGAVEAMLRRSLDEITTPGTPRDDSLKVFRDLGKAEFAAGRSLDSLHAAYRLGGQIVWRQLSAFARHHGVSPGALARYSEAISTHVARLSEASAEGYAAAQAKPDNRVRGELLALLLAESPAEPRALAEAARTARWALPGAALAVALRCTTGEPSPIAFPATVLADFHGEQPCLVVPADDPALATLAALPGWQVATGPVVPLADVRESLRLARCALDLAQRGLLPDEPVLDCGDHVLALMLFAPGNEPVVAELIESRLAPLDSVTGAERGRLLVTLREWLAARGKTAEIAAGLDVHPQTVRARVRRLTELFGDDLTDPRCRFELEIAVRAKIALLAGVSGA